MWLFISDNVDLLHLATFLHSKVCRDSLNNERACCGSYFGVLSLLHFRPLCIPGSVGKWCPFSASPVSSEPSPPSSLCGPWNHPLTRTVNALFPASVLSLESCCAQLECGIILGFLTIVLSSLSLIWSICHLTKLAYINAYLSLAFIFRIVDSS